MKKIKGLLAWIFTRGHITLPEIIVTPMRLSEQGSKLIRHYEGCKLKAYKDPAGIPTIGYGNTFYEDGKPVKMGDEITQQRADELFALITPRFEQTVRNKINRQMLQHEFDAAVSFCYNAGTSYKTAGGTWKDYDIWKHIQNRYAGIEGYWQGLAITAGGVKLNGLVKRRKSEAHLYITGELKFY